MLEILAARLMAPYVGVSLNTYTGIIGTVLGGIAAGAWVGGWAADRVPPRYLLGPLLIVGGLLVMTSSPLVTLLGEHLHAASLRAIIALSAATVFLPAFVLSAVTPVVVKMQLQDLTTTGRVVGRMSGIATAGALVGTFGTGFILAERLHTHVILLIVGAVLVALGAILSRRLMRRLRPIAAVLLIGAVLTAAAAGAGVQGPCKVESGYFCIRVLSAPPGDSGRILMLDDVAHSYADVGNPRYLGFPYVRVLAAAMDGLAEPGERLAVLHIGGGAFTLPMYVAATRPGSVNKVMEIDPAVVDTARADFGLRSGPRLQVEVGDAGVLTTRERPLSYDFIVGDAFSSRSPPWQLTTREFLGRLRKLLRPRGAYLMNVIDDGRAFVRAEAATMQRVFPHVVVLELPGETNHVLVGANAPIDVAALRRQAMRMGVPVLPLTGASLGQLIGDAHVLENDFAPVDQLLNAGGSPVVAQR